MNAKARQRPFFVYGTLLPGQINDHFWEARQLTCVPARFPNGRLFDMGHYPALLEGGRRNIRGMLISLDPQFYAAVLRRLDKLEGYEPLDLRRCSYLRVLRQVNLGQHRTAMAWVYLGRPSLVKGKPAIECNSWLTYLNGDLKPMLDPVTGIE